MVALGELPRKVRVSFGSAVVLGLLNGRLNVAPTTAYLMTYKDGKCLANCGFCPQARGSRSRVDMLSRISWPSFRTELVLNGVKVAFNNGKVKRVCIQTINYPNAIAHARALLMAVKRRVNIPTSVSCQPTSSEDIRLLAEAGAERIGIPLDAVTEDLFEKVKGAYVDGPYRWSEQLKLLEEAIRIFGKGKVSTHFIVGLGETEMDVVSAVQTCVDMGVLPALFAFTPIPGTALEHTPQPPIVSYRRVQVARYLIVHGISRYERMAFNGEGHISYFGVNERTLLEVVRTGKPFLTSGCPDCNRPYYNERPSGPIYNYPVNVSQNELSVIEEQLGLSTSDRFTATLSALKLGDVIKRYLHN